MSSIIINLHYLKINSISGNGSVTIGEAAYNSPTAYNKSQGMNSSYGDTSPTEAMMENILIDPDVNDQTAIGNSDNAFVNPNRPIPLVPPVPPVPPPS
ncbi:spore germination protein [Mesobacillus maritimus]|uniref:spore germination protein n=1 Tax=Mesobacillus maritimus TaxID=1643336 RepID=UPI00203D6BF8|nr:spore germination protein [Mesobacillus maritimus]MCM3584831.1 spore germination protein [Mesobacillus maritimus]MCM3671246.1 spore germination protein [Mesobacillus maritimus]